MTREQIEQWLLAYCTVSTPTGCAPGTGLNQIHQRLFGHRRVVNKAQCAKDLAAWYAEARNITDVWEALGANEKNSSRQWCNTAGGSSYRAQESSRTRWAWRSQFLTKVNADVNAAIYKIDFPSMVRAFHKKIQPKDILAYLRKASTEPIPANVLRLFEGWQAKVGRVKIRTVTLLETNDPLLLQELMHTKGIEARVQCQIQNAAALCSESDIAQVRAAAEKNGWLVDAANIECKRKAKR